MADRYGAVPEEAKLLGELMVIKAYARRLGAVSVALTADRLVLAHDSALTPLKPEAVLALINKKNTPYKLTPDMRLLRAFNTPERTAVIESAKKALRELAQLS